MSSSSTWAAGLLGAGVLAASASSGAAVVSGRYFDIVVSEVSFPQAQWSAEMLEAADGLSTSLVISAKPGAVPAVDTWSISVALGSLILHGAQANTVLTTNGTQVFSEVNLADWSLTATGAFSAAPADALFKTAYGENTFTSVVSGSLARFTPPKTPNPNARPVTGTQTLILESSEGGEPLVFEGGAELPGTEIGRAHV